MGCLCSMTRGLSWLFRCEQPSAFGETTFAFARKFAKPAVT
jgi:hypothetical protein